MRTRALSMGMYMKLVNAYRLDPALRAETKPWRRRTASKSDFLSGVDILRLLLGDFYCMKVSLNVNHGTPGYVLEC
jgi:hypothetical protein